jgi:hypothetical protein
VSNHDKEKHPRESTGPVDRDRNTPGTKMNREMRNTDARGVGDRDLRGKGRQAVEQQERERDFDRIDTEPPQTAA